ncbi:secreted protein [Melampsora americana]|nr:secreted protein [Melampsora americana]
MKKNQDLKNRFKLLFFLQLFFIFDQVRSHLDEVSLRSFKINELNQSNLLEKRQFDSNRMNSAIMMKCHISRKYTSQKGLAQDCFQAINYLYNAPFPKPACAICRTCAVYPLDGKQNPVGGINGNPPQLSQGSINAAYNNRFSDKVWVAGEPDCRGYELPNGIVDTLPAPGTFWAPYLLGISAGQGNSCQACSDQLTQEVFKHGG